MTHYRRQRRRTLTSTGAVVLTFLLVFAVGFLSAALVRL